MDRLLYPAIVRQLLDAFAQNPRGSIHIVGPGKSGKTASLNYLIDQIRGQRPLLNPIEQLSGPNPGYPLTSQATDYRLENIQKLIRRLALAVGFSGQMRLVVIDDFDRIPAGSQVVLLKYLEEPNSRTGFLISSNGRGVLATVSSRCQTIELRRPAKKDTLAWLEDHYPEADRETCYLKAAGWPAACVELLENGDQSVIGQQINYAKDFLGQNSSAERLGYLEQLKSQSIELKQLLGGLTRVSWATLGNLADKNNLKQLELWQRRLIRFNQLAALAELGVGPTVLGLKLSLIVNDAQQRPESLNGG